MDWASEDEFVNFCVRILSTSMTVEPGWAWKVRMISFWGMPFACHRLAHISTVSILFGQSEWRTSSVSFWPRSDPVSASDLSGGGVFSGSGFLPSPPPIFLAPSSCGAVDLGGWNRSSGGGWDAMECSLSFVFFLVLSSKFLNCHVLPLAESCGCHASFSLSFHLLAAPFCPANLFLLWELAASSFSLSSLSDWRKTTSFLTTFFSGLISLSEKNLSIFFIFCPETPKSGLRKVGSASMVASSESFHM